MVASQGQLVQSAADHLEAVDLLVDLEMVAVVVAVDQAAVVAMVQLILVVKDQAVVVARDLAVVVDGVLPVGFQVILLPVIPLLAPISTQVSRGDLAQVAEVVAAIA